MRIVVTLALLCLPAQAAPQYVVSGTFLDSLRGRSPVAGAIVIVAGAPSSVVTDSEGRFTVALQTRPDTLVLRAWADVLDSIALPPLEYRHATAHRDSITIELSTPSVRTYIRYVCGRDLNDSEGVVVGFATIQSGIYDSEPIVAAAWTEYQVVSSRVEARHRQQRAASNLDGSFALCGVPIARDLHIAAQSSRDDTGDALVQIGTNRVAVVGIALGHFLEARRLVVRVLGANGSVVRNARVAQMSADTILALSGENGLALLDKFPVGSRVISVSAIGFEPTTLTVSGSQLNDTVSVIVTPLALGLDTIRVVAQAAERARLEFEERRRFNHSGTFLDDSTLLRYPVVTPSVLRDRVPRSTSTGGFRLLNGNFACAPRWFVDGGDIGQLGAVDQDYWLQRAKRIEVYRAAFAPPRFADLNGCGSVLVWTR